MDQCIIKWGNTGWSNASFCALVNSSLTLCCSHILHMTEPQSHASLVCVLWSYFRQSTCSHIHRRGTLGHSDCASASVYWERILCGLQIHIGHIGSSFHWSVLPCGLSCGLWQFGHRFCTHTGCTGTINLCCAPQPSVFSENKVVPFCKDTLCKWFALPGGSSCAW